MSEFPSPEVPESQASQSYPDEPRLSTRRSQSEVPTVQRAVHSTSAPASVRKPAKRERGLPGKVAFTLIVLLLLAAGVGWLVAAHWVRGTAEAALPQLDGTLPLAELSAPVTVRRDARGVPSIQASNLDDLIFAQGFVTAGDRLFQMDLIRRHAAGELAEVFGSGYLAHDRLQRTLQIRASADRALAQLPPDQVHLLEQYSRGVNALIAQNHLPVEFHLLHYTPAPWTPRDSLLVSLTMFEDLTNGYPAKLAREALTAQLPADLIPDLYPVGSWRDHPPTRPVADLSIPVPEIEQIPLDETQSSNTGAPQIGLPGSGEPSTGDAQIDRELAAVLGLGAASSAPSIAPFAAGGLHRDCPACVPGSNNWVVSGAHTASGKPLLSNDMHLNLTVPGIWYESNLDAPVSGAAEPLHVAGVTIPGLPLIVVGHNAHVAWGFTNLGADVQDVYIETLRGNGEFAEFLGVDGSWQPVVHIPEHIRVKHGVDQTIDVIATRHGDAITPILSPTLPGEMRTLSLRWTFYDPAVLQLPLLQIAEAHDWTSFLAAFSTFGGPTQNVVYADDQGHIGYHAAGRIPMRGPAPNPAGSAADLLPDSISTPVDSRSAQSSPTIAADTNPLARTDLQAAPAPTAPMRSGPLSPVPLVPSIAHEWTGYIPFDQLPQVLDPPGGLIATANARITPDDYPYPITLNWGAPYRNERIWHVLAHTTGLTPANMLNLQSDVYSDFDHVLAQRLAYALDHSDALNQRASQAGGFYKPARVKALHQAADLLRTWNGRMSTESPAAAIVASTHAVLWPMLLGPHLSGRPTDPALGDRRPTTLAATQEKPAKGASDAGEQLNALYTWYERDYALEQILMHTPPRWLSPAYKNFDDLLAAAVDRGLTQANAPADLSTWHYGQIHTVDLEHPIFMQSGVLRSLLGRLTGTRNRPQSGDGTTVKQTGHSFGPSERLTVDLADPDATTLNLVLGQSGNPDSPWFLDQFSSWLRGASYPFPFSETAAAASATHTLTLTPQ
jgi:penicillin amidase